MLSVEITSPQDGAELAESQAAVTGTVSDAEATVTVNGVVVANNNGTFSAQVVLNEGENTITASAILGELQAQDSVTVTYNPNPAPVPTVEITSPADGAVLSESLVTITGTVSPQGAVVTVNGVVVANHGNNGTFSAQVLLAEGDNTITAAAILGQGQLRAEASVTVTFTPTSALALTSIAVTPASPANLAVGATQQFTATGTYADNSTANVTSQVTWASSNTGTATISAAGLATGVAAGTTNITASLSGVTSPVVGLTVVGPPTVSSTIPANAATGVAINSAITAAFSEAMDPLTVTDVTFTLKQGTTPVLGAVTYAGVTATFTPDVDLTASTNYTATITTGAKDLAGNALASNFVWSFTTGATPDTTAPEVSSTIPDSAATDVDISSAITAVFSEAMDPLTVTTATFTLKHGTTSDNGTVTYAGVTATFTPASTLAPSTVYTATITTGAKDLAGNAVAINKAWTFTTGAQIAQSPVDLGSAGNFAILTKSGISTTGTTNITGDIGVSPSAASYITGFDLAADNSTQFSTSSLVTGRVYAADYAVPTPANMTTAVSRSEEHTSELQSLS
jgi:hypothetical protein